MIYIRELLFSNYFSAYTVLNTDFAGVGGSSLSFHRNCYICDSHISNDWILWISL